VVPAQQHPRSYPQLLRHYYHGPLNRTKASFLIKYIALVEYSDKNIVISRYQSVIIKVQAVMLFGISYLVSLDCRFFVLNILKIIA